MPGNTPESLLNKTQRVVNISDCIVTSNTNEIIVTYALGSCLGISIYDPVNKFGGLAHFMLPNSRIDKEKAISKPFMFVDTGIITMINKFVNAGSELKKLQIKVAGCSQIMDANSRFNIGERNFAIMRKFLWKNGLLMDSHEIGDNKSRTMYLSVSDGKVYIRTKGIYKEL